MQTIFELDTRETIKLVENSRANRTKRPKITDGWKVTNHDRPTPQESYGQQHHG